MSGVVSSVLKPQLTTVNAVNALTLAKDRGVTITEEKTETSPNFGSTLSVRVETASGTLSVTGALFGGEPRIVRMDDVRLEASLSGCMLYLVNEDKPGFIAALGETLREADLNVATFNLGRRAEGGEALALIALDCPDGNPPMDAIRALPQVRKAEALRF
jgi:D-3-phosphoglycerate dehydrogenase